MLTLTLSLIWWRFNTVVLPRRKESSRSLSHLCDEFFVHNDDYQFTFNDLNSDVNFV